MLVAPVSAFAVRCATLTAIWTLLWGELSAANVVSGVVVSSALLAVFPARRRTTPGLGPLRLLGAIRFLAYLGVQLAVSNVLVAREIVSRRTRIRTGIVACRLRTRSPSMIAFLANIVALTPGMMPVDVETDPAVLYVHVLMLKDVASARRDVARLESLAIRAFGTADDRARLIARPTAPVSPDPSSKGAPS